MWIANFGWKFAKSKFLACWNFQINGNFTATSDTFCKQLLSWLEGRFSLYIIVTEIKCKQLPPKGACILLEEETEDNYVLALFRLHQLTISILIVYDRDQLFCFWAILVFCWIEDVKGRRHSPPPRIGRKRENLENNFSFQHKGMRPFIISALFAGNGCASIIPQLWTALMLTHYPFPATSSKLPGTNYLSNVFFYFDFCPHPALLEIPWLRRNKVNYPTPTARLQLSLIYSKTDFLDTVGSRTFTFSNRSLILTHPGDSFSTFQVGAKIPCCSLKKEYIL